MIARLLGFAIILSLIVAAIFLELGRRQGRSSFRLGWSTVLTVCGALASSIGLIAYSGPARASIVVAGVCAYVLGLTIALVKRRHG